MGDYKEPWHTSFKFTRIPLDVNQPHLTCLRSCQYFNTELLRSRHNRLPRLVRQFRSVFLQWKYCLLYQLALCLGALGRLKSRKELIFFILLASLKKSRSCKVHCYFCCLCSNQFIFNMRSGQNLFFRLVQCSEMWKVSI